MSHDAIPTLPIALFNGTIATTNGIYEIEDIDIPSAKNYIQNQGFVSAIGHQATADILTDILDVGIIPMRRIQFIQEVGQKAIAFKLKQRPEEGRILTREEVESIGYTLKLMTRLQ